jgi:hypothetical protein
VVQVLEVQATQLKLPAMQLCAEFCRAAIAHTDEEARAAKREYAEIAEHTSARGEHLMLDPD